VHVSAAGFDSADHIIQGNIPPENIVAISITHDIFSSTNSGFWHYNNYAEAEIHR
jgi:hypothetical protein